MNALLCCAALLAVHDETYLAWMAEPVANAKPAATTGTRLSREQLAELGHRKPIPPFSDLTTGVRAADGGLWVGSQHGLMLLAPQATQWRVFHSRRWLPADDVTDLTVIQPNEVLAMTSEGAVRIKQQEMTLARKMAEINDNIQKHHLRFGLVGEVHLKEPGNLAAGYRQQTNDNDGLWTSLYVAAEAFRYGATGDPAAKKNARAALEALMFLERITGIPGFVARSVLTIDDDSWKHGGEWHKSADGKWWWKGDTSSDEVDGHYFAYSIYHDVAATDDEKKEISAYVARITDHIIDHGFYYVGPSGQPTTWGVWAPEKLNHDLKRLGDRGLNSLEILSHLKVAQHIVGNPRYAAAAKELIEKHAYATNTVLQKHTWPLEMTNHSDDELAFTAYYPLVIYERDPELRSKYMTSLRRTWMVERPEHSPFFNFIYAAGLQANEWTDPLMRPDAGLVPAEDYDREACIEWFREVPQDTMLWTVKNSHRRDVTVTITNRFKRARGDRVLPIAERHVMKWNGDPYQLDHGGDGRARDDGTFILLPYWMGEYRRLLD
jgi:hypothetical protein